MLEGVDYDSLLDVTTKNPFPGMNPFFEQQWRDAHTSLLTYFRDALQEQLPSDLVARAEEEVVTIGAESKGYRPDVQVREPWTLKEPGSTEAASGPRPPTTEPILVYVEEGVERWLEVRDQTGRLITALELLSPSNKLEFLERERYLRKRRNFIGGGANLVEIDLVRQGTPIFPAAVRRVLLDAGASYGVCVFRAGRPNEHEVYPIGLRERLPIVRVPLRPSDPDVTLELQPLINQCHERGRYYSLKYDSALDPPLSPEEAAWADKLLRDHQLL